MSFNAMQAALRIPGLPPTEKLVLIALADHAGTDGRGWPSVPALAREAGVSDRQVQRILGSLQVRGLIRREPRQRRNRARTSDLYVLTLPAAGPAAAPRPRAGERRDSPSQMSPPPVTPTSPRPVTPTSPEREQTTPNQPQGTSEPVGSERARARGDLFSDEAMSPEGTSTAARVRDSASNPPLPNPPLPSPSRRRRSHRCPPDYAPCAATLAFAEANGLAAAEVAHELDRLKDHEFRTPRADWDAAFRNWLRTTLETPRHARSDRSRQDLARHPFAGRPEGHWRGAGRRGGDAPGGRDPSGARLPVPAPGAGLHALALGQPPFATSPPDPRRTSTDARRNAWIALAEEFASPRPG